MLRVWLLCNMPLWRRQRSLLLTESQVMLQERPLIWYPSYRSACNSACSTSVAALQSVLQYDRAKLGYVAHLILGPSSLACTSPSRGRKAGG